MVSVATRCFGHVDSLDTCWNSGGVYVRGSLPLYGGAAAAPLPLPPAADADIARRPSSPQLAPPSTWSLLLQGGREPLLERAAADDASTDLRASLTLHLQPAAAGGRCCAARLLKLSLILPASIRCRNGCFSSCC